MSPFFDFVFILRMIIAKITFDKAIKFNRVLFLYNRDDWMRKLDLNFSKKSTLNCLTKVLTRITRQHLCKAKVLTRYIIILTKYFMREGGQCKVKN